jgi:mRNA interferase RelE/StbE
MSGRTVLLSAMASKMLARIDRATRDRIMMKIHQLADDPQSMLNNVKPMKGSTNLWRLRVGDWRVLYTETFIVVSVIRIAPRGSVYE